MLATEIGKMQAETTGRTTETKPLIAIPSSMGADSEQHPPMPGIGLEMKCTQDVMGLCACPKPDCAPIGNKNPVILHLAAKAIGSLGPVTKQLLETPDGIGSPAVITAEKCAWTWSVSKHEENKTSSKAS